MLKDAGKTKENPETKITKFWDYTEELAQRLKVAMYTFIASTIIIMILPADLSFLKDPLKYYQPLVAVILRKIREDSLPPHVKLIGLELVAPIQLYIIASIIFGAAITFPIILYEIYKFIEPALYPHEKKDLYPFLFSFLALFISGLIFGYKILTPYLMWAMMPFFSAVGAEMTISIMDFYSLLLLTTLATGLFFTFPVFFVLLVKYEIVSTEVITKNRRYVYAALFILTAIITPDGGQIGNIILLVPMILLLEIGVLFAKRYEKKEVKRRIQFFHKEPRCKFCGEILQDGMIFCPKCGRSQK